MQRWVLAIPAILVLAATVAGTAVASGSPPDEGSIGIRLLEAPAGAEDDPRAQVHIVDHLAPGTTITRRIEVSNTSETTLHAVLYPSAATIDEGSFVGGEGRTENDLSSWTTVSPTALDVPARSSASATVVVAVPGDAAPGEQYAVVWAEARSTPSDGAGIAQVSRVGVRLYLSVGPGGAPAADFSIEALGAERTADGTPRILATVHNTGGRALDLAGSLELADGPGGVRAGPFPATLGTTLAIDATDAVTVELDGNLPAGPWAVTIALRSGRVERTAHGTITFPSPGEASLDTATHGGGGRALAPLTVGLGLVATGVAGAGALRLRRRGRRRVLAPS